VAAVPVRATRENLAAHADVLTEAVRTATVLPARFGFVLPDDDAVRSELLRARREELERLLVRFRGKVELNVRAFYEEDVVLREVVAANEPIAQLSAKTRSMPEAASYYDRIRLGQLVAEAVEQRRAADEKAIVDRLTPLAADVRKASPLPERMVTNASFLVERGRVEEFDAVAAALAEAEASRIRFKYVGPLAPHTFADLAAAGTERAA
jgi:hypothetical protein